MPNNFPYQLVNTFFISLNFDRPLQVTEQVDLNIAAEMKITETQNPTNGLQVVLRLRTEPKELSVMFSFELVGLFECLEDNFVERTVKVDYLNARGLHLLWFHAAQMVKTITGQMGMNPININIPLEFNIQLPALE